MERYGKNDNELYVGKNMFETVVGQCGYEGKI